MTARAAGPLGAVVQTAGTHLRGLTGYALGPGANALVLLHRTAFVDEGGTFDTKAEDALLAWAKEHNLGQDRELLARAAARRQGAVAAAAAGGAHRRLVVSPLWRLAVGLGNRTNPYEIGLSLHGTYGCPVIPGSTLKGVTCAWAAEAGIADTTPATFDSVFGLPRVRPADPSNGDESHADARPHFDDRPAKRGSVTFLDALPVGGPVTIVRDVVTPHVQPYYRSNPEPPAEYHQPIPSEFLVVQSGQFAIDLLGPQDDVDAAAEWCRSATDDLGVGGKTAAGYGYLTVEADR